MSTGAFDLTKGPREGMIKEEVTAKEKAGRQFQKLVPSRDDLIDLGFAAALTGIALVGFRTGFFGWMWIFAAVMGVLIGLAISHLTTSFKAPGLITFVLLLVAYFLLGGPFAVRDNLIVGVVPSLTTFKELATTPISGWKEWLTMLPPIDAVGHLVALPFLTGLFGAAVSYAVARTWRNAYVVVLMPLVLLFGSILLGTIQPASLLVQGGLGALLLIGWMTARAHRNRPALQNGAGKQSRIAIGAALLLVSGVVGWVAGPFLPGGEGTASREVVRTHLVPPFNVAQFISPLAGFRKYTEPNAAELYDKEILRVSGLPAGEPVRFAVLDAYDGSVWGAGDTAATGTSDPGKAFQHVSSRIAANAPGRKVTATFTIPEGGYSDVWLPTVGTVTGISFEGARERTLAENLWLNTDTNTAVQAGRIGAGDSYVVDAIVPSQVPAKTLPGTLEVASGSIAGSDYSSFLNSSIDKWSGDASGSWERMVAIAKYFQGQGTYTDGGTENINERYYLPGHSQGRLGRFVGGAQLAGNDEQYASTLALAGNLLNVPTRVVMGAIPVNGVVKGQDVHAWVEVQTATEQWVPLMPETFMPDRSKKPNQQQIKNPEQQAGAQVPPPSGVNPPSILQGPDQAQNATNIRKLKTSAFDPSTWPAWLYALIFYVVLPILTIALILGLIVLLKFLLRKRHATKGAVPRRATLIWRDLVAEARAVGIPVPAKATRLEESAALAADGSLQEMAATANAHVFGAEDPEPAQTDALWAQARQARKTLRKTRPLWRRALASADPRPLFTGRSISLKAPAAGRRFALPTLRKAASS